jgi:hypothetical protein
MKLNLTLNLDEDGLRELQIVAAEAGLSTVVYLPPNSMKLFAGAANTIDREEVP